MKCKIKTMHEHKIVISTYTHQQVVGLVVDYPKVRFHHHNLACFVFEMVVKVLPIQHYFLVQQAFCLDGAYDGHQLEVQLDPKMLLHQLRLIDQLFLRNIHF